MDYYIEGKVISKEFWLTLNTFGKFLPVMDQRKGKGRIVKVLKPETLNARWQLIL